MTAKAFACSKLPQQNMVMSDYFPVYLKTETSDINKLRQLIKDAIILTIRLSLSSTAKLQIFFPY